MNVPSEFFDANLSENQLVSKFLNSRLTNTIT